MHRGLRFVVLGLGLALVGCVGRVPLPTLSLHAFTWLKQHRQAAEAKGAQQFGLSVQLAFAPNPSRGAISPAFALQPMAAVAIEACADAALCEWATLAEESALSALGVTP